MRRISTQSYPPMGFESGMFGRLDSEEGNATRTVRSIRIGLMRNLCLNLTLSRHESILDEMK